MAFPTLLLLLALEPCWICAPSSLPDRQSNLGQRPLPNQWALLTKRVPSPVLSCPPVLPLPGLETRLLFPLRFFCPFGPHCRFPTVNGHFCGAADEAVSHKAGPSQAEHPRALRANAGVGFCVARANTRGGGCKVKKLAVFPSRPQRWEGSSPRRSSRTRGPS